LSTGSSALNFGATYILAELFFSPFFYTEYRIPSEPIAKTIVLKDAGLNNVASSETRAHSIVLEPFFFLPSTHGTGPGI
jgi:hypothetical protein